MLEIHQYSYVISKLNILLAYKENMIPSSISQKIEETIKFLEDKGSPIRRRIADIDEVPFDQFEDLQRSLGKRETIIFLSSLNYDTTVFSLFSTKIESLLGTIYLAIPYLDPVRKAFRKEGFLFFGS